ncbi:EamA family transporter [Solirubrobacter deserti]|uniref:EamA family transporter n=1 Tax=Solirubrobacter deserti TaxID=2282478 RepID=A0ABT4RQL2_9ACTN|nr:EamA family transporter [Solirubrobacter deserti]MDA0140858.1 EamA family transporter [Solirubrobacter deserti]
MNFSGLNRGAVALAAIAPCVWGTTYLVTTEFLPPDAPLLSCVLRALPGGLVLLAIARCLPHGEWWWRSLILGLLNIGIFNALLFVAAYRLPGGVAATVTSTQPLLVAGLALLLLHERPTGWRLGWGAAGVAGVSLLVLRGNATFDLVGILAAAGAAVSMATGIVLTRRWGRPERVGLLAFTSWQLTAGGLLFIPLVLVFERPLPSLDGAAIGGYTWLAVMGGLVAYALWFQGLSRLPVTAVSFLVLLSPVVATALGWLVLDQPLTALQTLGFVVALASILAAQLHPSRRRTAA